jgi:preprotein translocase subunit SecF
MTRLYTGTGAFDIVGRRRLWYALFGALMAVCLASIVLRGFNLGVDFTGGTLLEFPTASTAAPVEVEAVRTVVERAVGVEPTVQITGSGATQAAQIRTETLDPAQLVAVKQALFDTFQPVGASGAPAIESISDRAVSGSWGGQITRQALIALGVFLVLVTIFLTLYFERSMAIAALVALVHDVVVTAGIYSLVGFEVSPATVIGLLTILGFSLYDTVVVFDKVSENTRGLLGLSRRTYGEAANLALNQTLIRSINTSLIAVLPVLGLLVIGVGLLGVGVLADLALVQMVGIIAGALSSLLLATPLLVDLKMRDPRFRDQAERVRSRRATALSRAGSAPAVASGSSAAPLVEDESGVESTDDESVAREIRRERALTAAAGVPARTGKGAHRPAAQGPAQRPTGKRRR